MVRSIRLRLQLWYGAILGATIVVLGLLLFLNLRSSWLAELDSRLVGNLHYLDAILRRLPPSQRPPGFPPPPRGSRRGGPPSWEDFLKELELPGNGNEPGYNKEHGPAKLVFAIWRSDGKLIHDSGIPEYLHLSLPEVTTDPELWDDPPWRLGAMLGPERTVIMVVQEMGFLDQRLKSLARNLILFGGLAIGLGLLGGWFVSERILRPVKEISGTATAINASNLSKRIEIANLDRELVPLGSALNAMLDRLDRAFQNQVQFTADASHELRTPLTVIKSQAEWALSRSNRPETDYREALDACLRGTRRMERLVEDLLDLARADAETAQAPTETIDLALVVSEAMSFLSDNAKSRQIELVEDLQSVTIQASAKQIERLAINLIGNAITHNPADTVVRVTTGIDGEPFLRVSDNGVGIDSDAHAKLGERFFRPDTSRSKAGSGLGIALVKGIVEAHGAQLQIESEPGKGSTFTVKFPAVPVNKTI